MRGLTFTKVTTAVVVLALIAAGVLLVRPGGGEKHLTAAFPRAVSLYAGSDVRILGVSVGQVDSVRPTGKTVQVTLHYDAKYSLPKDAKAILVSPSIVGDRFIQLTPVYTTGAKLGDNASFGVDRTATPLELDQIYGSLNDLSVALGPDGANAKDGTGVGALTRLLESTSKNFGGQGKQFNDTITNVAGLTSTLDASKDNLFGTARELETFINTLAKNDTTVRKFNDSLSSAADLLAGERNDLASALRNLSTALVAVRGFVQDNKDQLTQNISKLNKLATTLVKRRGEIDSILSDAPVALNNLGLAYNPKVGTLDTRADLLETGSQIQANPAAALCGLVTLAKGPTDACLKALSALKLPRTAPLQTTKSLSDPNRFVDRSLGGLVEAGR